MHEIHESHRVPAFVTAAVCEAVYVAVCVAGCGRLWLCDAHGCVWVAVRLCVCMAGCVLVGVCLCMAVC